MEKLKSWLLKVVKVVVTLIIWLGLALAAATIVALIPSVQPCLQRGLAECRTVIVQGLPWEREQANATESRQPGQPVGQQAEKHDDGGASWVKQLMDWVILLVSLIVAVRIMYPPEDLSVPPKETAAAPQPQ